MKQMVDNGLGPSPKADPCHCHRRCGSRSATAVPGGRPWAPRRKSFASSTGSACSKPVPRADGGGVVWAAEYRCWARYGHHPPERTAHIASGPDLRVQVSVIVHRTWLSTSRQCRRHARNGHVAGLILRS